MDFETVMSLSGHKSLSMLKCYTHTNKKAKKEAVEKLEKYMKIEKYSNKMLTNDYSIIDKEPKVVNLSS